MSYYGHTQGSVSGKAERGRNAHPQPPRPQTAAVWWVDWFNSLSKFSSVPFRCTKSLFRVKGIKVIGFCALIYLNSKLKFKTSNHLPLGALISVPVFHCWIQLAYLKHIWKIFLNSTNELCIAILICWEKRKKKKKKSDFIYQFKKSAFFKQSNFFKAE